ncbi:hypothetical protein D3C87_588380 [compost metagenome]
MPVEFVSHMSVNLCRSNPTWAFVFGDNAIRRGTKGQAVIRNEPNAIGVRTKWYPNYEEASYFTDLAYDDICALIDQDFEVIEELLREGCTVVFPEAGLGTGLAEMPQRAPRAYSYLVDKLIMASQIC